MTRTTSAPTRAAWVWWLLVGAALGLGVVGILTIGVFVLPIAFVLALVGMAAPRLRNESVLAVLAGMAAPALYLAWLNRSGPGTVCAGDTCTEQYSPWPFVAVAVILVTLTVVLVRVTRRSEAA
jgi:hypothetical protein